RWRYRGFYNVLSQLNEIFTRLTYPFLRPFRRLLRRVDTAGIDWSPLLLLLAIFLIRRLLIAAILTP
ncbi:MAG TPA: YggT family protein, partial [Thermoanaerobaculia bacterium]